MGFFERIFRNPKREDLLREQAAVWAARHYPDGKRAVAAATVLIVAEQQSAGLEQLSPETRFIQDLQMHDPCEGVELVLATEQQFGIKIPEERAESMQTIGDLTEYLYETVHPA